MPRRLRVDAPGTIHHVFVRGIERRDLFLDDHDRWTYLECVSRVATEEGAGFMAWALESNHAHFVARTGHGPLARVMHRIGTRYGRYFNERYGREGYVFQGRYGARHVTSDADLLSLIRYVHRNPIGSGSVGSLDALDTYRWTGHAALMGRLPPLPFQLIDEAFALFGSSIDSARAAIAEWMRQLDDAPRVGVEEPELSALIAAVCEEVGADENGVRQGRRTRPEATAREMIALRARRELGISTGTIARALGVSRQALWERLSGERGGET
jgi:REP element-mobilizing transposase RayT